MLQTYLTILFSACKCSLKENIDFCCRLLITSLDSSFHDFAALYEKRLFIKLVLPETAAKNATFGRNRICDPANVDIHIICDTPLIVIASYTYHFRRQIINIVWLNGHLSWGHSSFRNRFSSGKTRRVSWRFGWKKTVVWFDWFPVRFSIAVFIGCRTFWVGFLFLREWRAVAVVTVRFLLWRKGIWFN
jgi:hypothetical protein